MMKRLNIPFFSQLDSSVSREYQRHVCTIACLKMIFDFKGKSLSFDDIYQEAMFVRGTRVNVWNHETLVRILRNHAVLAYQQEFIGHNIDITNQIAYIAEHVDFFTEKGIDKIKKSIDDDNPVCVSVKKGFSQNKEDHMVLIVGYTQKELFILDPIVPLEQNPKKINIEDFKKFWKGLTIFVE